MKGFAVGADLRGENEVQPFFMRLLSILDSIVGTLMDCGIVSDQEG